MTRLALPVGFILLLIGVALLLREGCTSALSTDPQSLELHAVSPATWQTYTTESGFSAKFPAPPQRASEAVEDRNTGEKRRYDMYVAETVDGRVFMVSVITFGHGTKLPNDQQLMRKVIMEMVDRKPANRLGRMDAVLLHGKPAVDFAVAGDKAHIEGTVFVDHGKLYLLSEVVPNNLTPDEFPAFRDSFQLESP